MDQREQLEQETVEFVDPTLEPSAAAADPLQYQEMAVDAAWQPTLDPATPERFPVVWRGYDRDSVDGLLAELEAELEQLRARHEPHAAVKQEIDRIGAATSDILRVAQERAERITSRAREEANARVDLAHAEAKQITAAAETRMRQLDTDADLVWQERRRLIDDTRQLADKLLGVADDATERFPEEEPGTASGLNGTGASTRDPVAATRAVPAAEPETG